MLKSGVGVGLLVVAALYASATPVLADPGGFVSAAECGENGGPSCDVSAGSSDSVPQQEQDGPPARPQQPQGAGEQAAAGSGGEQTGGGPSCGGGSELTQVPTDSGAPSSQLNFEGSDCSTTAAGGESGSGGQAVDPVAVAHAARASMSLPAPQMGGSPALEAEQLVGVPTWLWVDAGNWEMVSAEASVPGGSVEVTATPTTAVWHLGEGTEVECAGPGTPFDPAVHEAEQASPDCGHTFTRSSNGAPGGAFTVSVEVSWQVEWSTSEGGGAELAPLTTRAAEEVVVTESHGVVTRG